MSKLSLYLHTLPHLRLTQFVHQLRNRLPRKAVSAPGHQGRRERSAEWVPGPRREQSLFEGDKATFLQVQRHLPGPGSWSDAQVPMLWLYNLHYFDDLLCPAEDRPGRQELQQHWLSRWIAENPQGSSPGWDPYPTALRIVNWVKADLEGFTLPDSALDSMALQAEHLSRRLEYHLLANHLWADAKGLIFAGLFLQGPAAERWLRLGLEVAERELAEQVLADGAHYELSPMYSGVIHEDLLDVIQLLECYRHPLPSGWRSVAERMAAWSRMMLHPDRDIAFFNDASFGIAPSHEQRQAYAESLGLVSPPEPGDGLHALRESGYYRLQQGEFVLLADAAAVGPNYQPGHAHADTLSFEMSWREQRIFVNTGTSCYGTEPRRSFERSTAAHNTIAVNGKDSSEVWGAFRVARRAQVSAVETESSPKLGLRLRARHGGYRRLPGGPFHSREWRLQEDRLVIEDRLLPDASRVSAKAFLLLHPEVEVESQGSGFRLRTPKGELALSFQGGAARVEDADWSPSFDTRVATRRLAIDLSGAHLVTQVQPQP